MRGAKRFVAIPQISRILWSSRNVFRETAAQMLLERRRMKLIRYKTKPERTQENAELIAKVFEELHATAPGDVGYLALRLADGSFVHIVAAETEEGGKLHAYSRRMR